MPSQKPSIDSSQQKPQITTLALRVRGQVQGVGFRPFVWSLAQKLGLTGEVWNDTQGVGIIITGAQHNIQTFIHQLQSNAPPLSHIETVETKTLPQKNTPPSNTFVISASRGVGAHTAVTPDTATCPACIDEIHQKGQRHSYAFTNCTHCGPRFSILNALPYDRANTTMAGFSLCKRCQDQYENPKDRRFHAQPIACPDCGPKLWFEPAPQTADKHDAISLAVTYLKQGKIIAIKGIGGFHIACDATNEKALETLRFKKRRPTKPFAVMMTPFMVENSAHLSLPEKSLLHDPAAPIVIVKANNTLPPQVAPGLDTIGVMLAYTPLHHLLLDAFKGPLVMTSGNLSGEPQVISNSEARKKLSAFVDGFLMHDRDIAHRLDDSIERANPPMVLRRARGRVPQKFLLPPQQEGAQKNILALGGQMKSAICLIKENHALLSHHLGDIDNLACLNEFEKAIKDYSALFDLTPELLACDLHPGYQSTKYAQILHEKWQIPIVKVQHHHAHFAACLAENHWPLHGEGKALGVVLDGTGYGEDGTIWGGEIFVGSYDSFTRIGHLQPAPLAGGDKAAREPWRNGLMRLDQAGLSHEADHLWSDKPLNQLRAAVASNINSPQSSSMGRLFDAVAACMSICPDYQSYEGEAAIKLESLASDIAVDIGYEWDSLNPSPMFHALINDIRSGISPKIISARFHDGTARAFAQSINEAAQKRGIDTLALSGGCLQNARLLRSFQTHLSKELPHIHIYRHQKTPAGDGGLAYGQAIVALAKG